MYTCHLKSALDGATLQNTDEEQTTETCALDTELTVADFIYITHLSYSRSWPSRITTKMKVDFFEPLWHPEQEMTTKK